MGGNCTYPSADRVLPVAVNSDNSAILGTSFLRHGNFCTLPIHPPAIPRKASHVHFSLATSVARRRVGDLVRLV